MATKQMMILRLLLVLLFFFCYNLHVLAFALGQNSPHQSFKSENIAERGKAVEAARLGGRGGGENGNAVQAGGGMVPVYAAAGAAKKKTRKNGHHKGGCTKSKATESPLLALLLTFTALLF